MLISPSEKNRIIHLHESFMNVNGQLIHEEKFHELTTHIDFTFDLHHDVGGHTNQRKWRHGKDDRIYDLDIVRLLEDAKEEITYAILDGDIRNRRRFVVSREGGDDLNVVILPEELDVNHWNLVTITVMNKPDFTVGKGQLQIWVA
jgi:hypothetical protein